MEWYEKLSTYFPDNEMKDAGQMKALLTHHEAYQLYHSDDVVVTYVFVNQNVDHLANRNVDHLG